MFNYFKKRRNKFLKKNDDSNTASSPTAEDLFSWGTTNLALCMGGLLDVAIAYESFPDLNLESAQTAVQSILAAGSVFVAMMQTVIGATSTNDLRMFIMDIAQQLWEEYPRNIEILSHFFAEETVLNDLFQFMEDD